MTFHELLHTEGFSHAQGLYVGMSYGDPYDVMGNYYSLGLDMSLVNKVRATSGGEK